jgi:hypothetical protein
MPARAEPAAAGQAGAGEAGQGKWPAVASPEEDPNAIISCSSPPCFLHELDPSFLGYLNRDEVQALLAALLDAEWPGTELEKTWRRAMLQRHLDRLGGPPDCGAGGLQGQAATSDDAPGAAAGPYLSQQERLAQRLREALPRLHDAALRHDLEQELGTLERAFRRWACDPGLG